VHKSEAAALLGLSERGAVDAARAGKLPGAARVGREWTFDRDRLVAFIK
jgi:excisionase family DNA binding protein